MYRLLSGGGGETFMAFLQACLHRHLPKRQADRRNA
jgi:hypothetical protein